MLDLFSSDDTTGNVHWIVTTVAGVSTIQTAVQTHVTDATLREHCHYIGMEYSGSAQTGGGMSQRTTTHLVMTGLDGLSAPPDLPSSDFPVVGTRANRF